MIDTTSARGKAVAAALRLAERRPWSEITLLEIADEAGLTLAELSAEIRTKSALLRAFSRLVDDAVLRKVERHEPEEDVRERLFDVLMTRLDVMAPYKAGLKRILAEPLLAPELLGQTLASQTLMLAAAGVPTDGPAGRVRAAGLASVYAGTLRDWLDDTDPGLARTMAALDRRLRRGEGPMRRFDSLARNGRSLIAALASCRPGHRRRAEEPVAPAPVAPPPSEPGSTPGARGAPQNLT